MLVAVFNLCDVSAWAGTHQLRYNRKGNTVTTSRAPKNVAVKKAEPTIELPAKRPIKKKPTITQGAIVKATVTQPDIQPDIQPERKQEEKSPRTPKFQNMFELAPMFTVKVEPLVSLDPDAMLTESDLARFLGMPKAAVQVARNQGRMPIPFEQEEIFAPVYYKYSDVIGYLTNGGLRFKFRSLRRT